MFEIPLFPLNQVLMPMQPLALHIFEERYKEMIRTCLATDQPFGVVLLEQGEAEEWRSARPLRPHLVGTTAHITQVQELPEGRMNIVVVGRERFRITEFRHDRPYLVGLASYEPLALPGLVVPRQSLRALGNAVTRYLTLLEKSGRIQVSERRLPPDALSLCFLASAILHEISNEQRQSLLESKDVNAMIAALKQMYRRETILLQLVLSVPEQPDSTFSLN